MTEIQDGIFSAIGFTLWVLKFTLMEHFSHGGIYVITGWYFNAIIHSMDFMKFTLMGAVSNIFSHDGIYIITGRYFNAIIHIMGFITSC